MTCIQSSRVGNSTWAVNLRLAVIPLLLLTSGPLLADGTAEPIPSFYQEPGKSDNRATASSHPNEHVDPFTGKLQWHFTDVFIPGNGGFDLKVQRSYTASGELFPAPSPVGIGWTMHFGRVIRNANKGICDTNFTTSPSRNPVLELPDGSRQILYIDLAGTGFISTNMWKATCLLPIGLTVSSPDGTRYEMSYQGPSEGPPAQTNNTYYTTRIVDRNNNSMTIGYVNLGTHVGVSTVATSDARNLTFTYGGSTLSSITDGTRTWNYTYTGSGALAAQSFLTRVQPPAGPAWNYAYNDADPFAYAGAGLMRSVTYPTGGKIDYTYGYVNFATHPAIPRSTVVTRKTSSDAGTWTYTYTPATQQIQNITEFWANPQASPQYVDQTLVSGPDGDRTYTHIGYNSVPSNWVWSIGILVAVKTLDQSQGYSYSGMPISSQSNLRPGGTLVYDTQTYAPLFAGSDINRNGQNYTTTYTSMDAYGNPTGIKEVGTDTRTTVATYSVDTARWILHTKQNETWTIPSLGTTGTITRTFDANKNLLTETRYGVATTYTYTAAGDVASRKDARLNTTSFSSHYRGTAQTEARPLAVTITRVVSPAGNVTSETDGAGARTTYSFDGLNRVTAIGKPTGNSVTVAWGNNSRTVTRGGYQEVLTFDGFGRTTRSDHTAGTTSIFQTTRYDAAGRVVFKSYPNSTVGVDYTLDSLGRVTKSVSPGVSAGSSNRQYGFAYATVNELTERGQLTTYTYRAFGDPEQRDLIAVAPPDAAANVTIVRNGVGQPTQITQNGKTRSFVYDTRYYLTSKSDPETGTTTFGRDAVGNMTSRTVGASPGTSFVYDALNRLTTATYPTFTVSHGYYGDDKLNYVDTGTARKSFVYDGNKNLTQETLTVAGQTFAANYAYDGNDALSVLTYGSGKTVTYSPDGLGRPTAAAPYVTAVTHHANGEIASITYANGVTTTIGLNGRLWPKTLKIDSGARHLFDSTYDYDDVGNVTRIIDTVDGSYSRGMAYDGLDRLVVADGAWGQGSFSYDGRGNLLTQRLGPFALNYVYDGNERLTSVTGTKPYAFTYDAYGNVTNNGTTAFQYDDASNMRCSNCGQADQTTYDYDGQNMRVRAVKNGVTTYFVYGLGGKLLWERTPYSNVKEYVYLGGKQVATRQQGISGP
jgi:YD repeat-containing protein